MGRQVRFYIRNRIRRYRPDCDIVAIKASSNIRGVGVNSIRFIQGLSFLDSLANAQNKPYVAILSIEVKNSSHDGLNEACEYIASFIQGENGRGKAIVVAACNYRENKWHATGEITPGTLNQLSFSYQKITSDPTYNFINIYIEKVHPGADLTVITPSGDTLGTFNNGTNMSAPVQSEHGYYYQVYNAPNGPEPINGYKLLQLALIDGNNFNSEPDNTCDIAEGEWKLILDSDELGTWHSYIYTFENISETIFTSNVSEAGTVTDPAAREEVIAVGAYVSSNYWYMGDWYTGEIPGYKVSTTTINGSFCDFSGMGPTPTGVLKPEISAPGEYITGTMSGDAWPLAENTISMFFDNPDNPLEKVSPDSLHGTAQGTSFASPQVAGVCALLLEADPTLTNEEIKQIIISTATPDTTTGAVPNNEWGYGRLNAVDAVASVLGVSDSGSSSVEFATRHFPGQR